MMGVDENDEEERDASAGDGVDRVFHIYKVIHTVVHAYADKKMQLGS